MHVCVCISLYTKHTTRDWNETRYVYKFVQSKCEYETANIAATIAGINMEQCRC